MHILADHPQIAGYGEYFTQYNSPLDYRLAEFDIRRKSGTLFTSVAFVANQVNHHSITPNMELLIEQACCIFLFRDARPTLSSMLQLSDAKGMPMSQQAVAKNYMVRLQDMSNLAPNLASNHKFALTYQELLSSPEYTLNLLQGFLGLHTPLKSRYTQKGFTGRWGDPSKHIHKGEIVETRSPQREIEPEILQACLEEFRTTCTFFQITPEHASA